MASTFAAEVGDWVRKVQGAEEHVVRDARQELVTQLNTLVPIDTGFLRASLRASTTAMPVMSLENPGAGAPNLDAGEISLVIASADIGDTIYLGYTVNYGAHIHYGANGRAGRPWVAMVAQRWQQIVKEKAAEVRSRLGL